MPLQFGIPGPAGPAGATGAQGPGGAAGSEVVASSYSVVGNGSADDIIPLQTACNSAGGNWLDLEQKTSIITQPLILAPDQHIRNGAIKASPSFAPVDTNGAMVMQRQGGVVTVSNVDASTNVITTGAHSLNAGHIGLAGIVFKGTVPGGITAGRVYYVDSVPSGTTFTVRATKLGSTHDITSTTTGATVHLEVHTLHKLWVDQLLIHGNDVAGINGMAVGLQQQSELRALRVQNCPGTGLTLQGQQAHFDNLMLFGCGTGLALEDMKMLYVFTANLEWCEKAVHARATPQIFAAGGCSNVTFVGVHHEGDELVGADDVCFDLEGGADEFEIIGALSGSNRDNHKFIWNRGGGGGSLYGYTNVSSTGERPYVLKDDVRGHDLRVWKNASGLPNESNFKIRHWSWGHRTTSDSHEDRFPNMALYYGGGYEAWGTQVPSLPMRRSRAGSSQTGDQQQWLNSSETVVSAVSAAGKITLSAPTAASDAATKAYADSIAAGLDPHASVKAATTANITLSGTQTIDGVALVAADRVLVKNQTTTSANGIYAVASGAWSRATDADTGAELTGGSFVFIEQGTVHADQGWVATHNGTPTLGTDPITFTQFSGATSGAPSGAAGGDLTGTYPNPTLRNPAFFNVKAAPYNAQGDNSTDDTLAIQAALNAAGAGGMVWFPKGQYKVSDQGAGFCLDISTLDGITLAGASAARLNPSGQGFGSCIFTTSTSTLILKCELATLSHRGPMLLDLRIESRSASANGFSIKNFNNYVIERCAFRGVGQAGAATSTGLKIDGPLDASYGRVEGCDFHHHLYGALTLQSVGATFGGSNYFCSNVTNHVLLDLQGGAALVVMGNKFECSVASGAIAIRNGVAGGTGGGAVQIIGNNFEGCTTGVDLVARSSISATNTQVHANNFTGTNATETAIKVGTNRQQDQIIGNRYVNLATGITDNGTDTLIIGGRATQGRPGEQLMLGGLYIGTGTGSPEGVVPASVGALYLRRDGGVTTSLYVKTSGTGNTGWTAK